MFIYNAELFEAFLNRDIIVDLSDDPELEEEFIHMLSRNVPPVLVSSTVHHTECKCLCKAFGVPNFAMAEQASFFQKLMPDMPIIPVRHIITNEDNADEKFAPLETTILLEIIMS